jgi:hypothetical protein
VIRPMAKAVSGRGTPAGRSSRLPTLCAVADAEPSVQGSSLGRVLETIRRHARPFARCPPQACRRIAEDRYQHDRRVRAKHVTMTRSKRK